MCLLHLLTQKSEEEACLERMSKTYKPSTGFPFWTEICIQDSLSLIYLFEEIKIV
jgi:hypothetical protein